MHGLKCISSARFTKLNLEGDENQVIGLDAVYVYIDEVALALSRQSFSRIAIEIAIAIAISITSNLMTMCD